MKELVDFLKSLGSMRESKSGSGILIYNPKSFDANKLDSLASKKGLSVIYNDKPTFYNGREVPPKLYIGKVSSGMDSVDAEAYLESL